MKLSKSDLQLETLVSRIEAEELDLQPNFQRGEVWDRKRKQRLVDTLLRGWYVPAIHIVADEDGNESVLDGQQRLASIRDFFKDRFPVDGTIDPSDETISALHGKKFSQLPDTVQRSIRRFVVSVVTLHEFEPEEPNELFFRLNQAYNLTPPEKRNALHGVARDQVRGLVNDLAAHGLLNSSRIGFSNGRLAYDDIIARTCVSMEIADLTRHIKNSTVEEFYRDSKFSESTLDSVRAAGEWLLEAILATPDQKIRFNKGTLQTWLTYRARGVLGDMMLDHRILASFEHDRDLRKHGIELPANGFLREVIGIYDDRASYRVTDVSSVQARDLAIHLYDVCNFDANPQNGSAELVAKLRQVADVPERASIEVFDFISRAQWGSAANWGGGSR